jgi:hypothetical protein
LFLKLLKKWIIGALITDCCCSTVAGNDFDLVGEAHEAVVDGTKKLLGIASREIGAAYGAGEEGVPGEKERLPREVEADRALGVARGMEDGTRDGGFARADGDEFAVVEGVVGIVDSGGGDAQPSGLLVHYFDLREVVLVHKDGGSGNLLESVSAGDVVDMGVGDDDLLDGEVVFGEEGEDAGDVVAGVDDDGFAGGFVAEDGAVALEGAYSEGFEDHGELWALSGEL